MSEDREALRALLLEGRGPLTLKFPPSADCTDDENRKIDALVAKVGQRHAENLARLQSAEGEDPPMAWVMRIKMETESIVREAKTLIASIHQRRRAGQSAGGLAREQADRIHNAIKPEKLAKHDRKTAFYAYAKTQRMKLARGIEDARTNSLAKRRKERR